MPSKDRPPRETARARRAYADFVAMGDARSVKRLHAKYRALLEKGAKPEDVPSISYARLRIWASWHRWTERVEALTAGAARESEKADAQRIAKARQELREGELRLSTVLRQQAEEMAAWPIAEPKLIRDEAGNVVTILMPAKWTKDTISRLADIASKLGRLATDQPTQSVEHSGRLRITEIVADVATDGASDDDGDET